LGFNATQVMESIRQKQVAELIRRQFSMVLTEEGRYVYGTQALVTVTQVLMSPDLALAKVYLSIYNTENKQEVLLEMEENYPRLKQALHHRLKKQIRAMPEMKFYIDDTMDEVYKVEALFKKFKDGKEE
jgi:ribosome-binding factor A